MMKITGIKQQVKRSDRYSIYADEKYAFSLSERALVESGLHSGQELSKEQLERYKELSNEDKLYNRALRYVAMRPRTVWEIETYLKRKDSPAPLIEQITNKLLDLGLLNDTEFARSFARDRQLLRPTSRRKIILELKKKHVAEAVINDVLSQEATDENASLQAVIAKKRRQTKYQDDEKLMQYLARQGFPYGDIKAALHQDADY